MAAIEPQTRRRMAHTGLVALDEERACPGYCLYAPMSGPGDVYLIDLKGNVAHQWRLPYPPGLYGYLQPNGNLFYMGKIRDETWDQFLLWKQFKGGVLLEIDWDGKTVWEHRDRAHHHDARRTSGGGAIYLSVERVPEDVARRVKGGIPGTDAGGMWADVVIEVDSAGKKIWEWHAFEHLDYETDVITDNDFRDEWSHANTIVPLANDRVMISCRNISTVGIIDKKTGRFVWKLGHDMLAQQHDPSLLDNGHVLIFDNGTHRKHLALPFSRVIEIDPQTNQIVWDYSDAPLYNFFSPFISGARRLPNGNTLIIEGMFGRMFQVTPGGEVVWEYVNPHFHPAENGALTNAVFRANHYLAAEVPLSR
jgi:outer membrane protein assembly factor BamB